MATTLFLIVFLVIFAPSRGHLRLEYPLLAILLAVLVFRHGFGIFRRTAAENTWLFLFAIGGLLSIFAFNLHSDRFLYQDVLTLARAPLYAIILAVASSIRLDLRKMHVFTLLMLLMGVAAAAISLIQYYNIGGLNAYFLRLYREDALLAASSSYWDNFVSMSDIRRVIGTSGNPNDWGIILTFFALLSAYKLVFEPQLAWALLGGALVAAIISSGSRTAAAGFLIALAAGLAAGSWYGRVRPRQLLVALGAVTPLMLAGALFYATQFENPDRFSSRDIGSLNQRISLWAGTLEEYKSTLMLGRGPAKAFRVRGSLDVETAQARDNVFVSFFAQFGVVGVTILLGFMATLYRRLISEIRHVDHGITWWPLFMFSVFISWIVFGLAADSFFAIQVTYLMLLLYGITMAAPRQLRLSTGTSIFHESSTRIDGRDSHSVLAQ